jgi:hypothetical protein
VCPQIFHDIQQALEIEFQHLGVWCLCGSYLLIPHVKKAHENDDDGKQQQITTPRRHR